MKSVCISFLCFVPCLVFGQTRIRGIVTDEAQQAVPGANIILADTYDGTSTGIDGKFDFTSTETGEHTLVIRFVGYEEAVRTVILNGSDVVVAVTLKEAISELESVTITAGSFTASDASRRTVFRALDIATTAGATADIAGALNTLPGTQKVGETGRLFVRGGDGNEARTFIDGMLVLDAYGVAAPNTPSRGRFLPFMFKGTSFSTGGYSAEYGQALSSALVLESKDENELTRTDIGILSVGADVAHTQAWNGGSAAGKIQYTNIRPYFGLINQEVDWKKPPASLETVAAFRQRVGKEGMIKFYGNFTQTDFSLYNHDIDDDDIRTLYDLKNRYRYLNGFYKTPLNKNWSVRGGMSYTYLGNDAFKGDARLNETETGLHIKNILEGSLNDHIEFKTGLELIRRGYEQGYSSEVFSSEKDFIENIVGTFVESDVYFSNRLVARVGARFEYNSLNEQSALDPRFSLAYKTGDVSQVSFAAGQFRQTAKSQYTKLDNTLSPEKAQHYILNYQRIDDNRTFRVEAYYKRYLDLVKFANEDGTEFTNGGDGYAKGVELFWRDKKTVRGLDYWLSYSFLDTERDYLHFPKSATPYFASRHNFSVVGKYFFEKLKSQVGVTWSYTSGRPYNNPNEDAFNAGKTPYYSDLSLNWSYLPHPQVIVFMSATNLLGRDNIFGYEYSTVENSDGQYNRRAIRQAAPRFLFMGIFITFSKNKTMNQLPSL
jgi:hypothetical protein